MRTLLLSVSVAALLAAPAFAQDWKIEFHRELKAMGHRNWVVVADSAYPAQTSAGIRTIVTGADQIDVLKHVIEAMDNAKHVKPVIYFDAELKHIPENLAGGINAYRVSVSRLMGDRETQSVPHEELIAKLDKAGEKFRVIVLKTKMTLPYTSVFFELDCGYWGPENEKKLRQLMTPVKP